jgi:dihydrofolate reductase
MTIAIIAAMDKQQVIGYQGGLPWHLPDDLRRFKSLTMGKVLIMGRRTYQSLPAPLPGRQHLVVSKTLAGEVPGGLVAPSFSQALDMADGKDVMVVGGATMFAEALPIAQIMHLTLVDAEVPGDTFFPPWQQQDWQVVAEEQRPADEQHAYAFCYLDLTRAGT